jgi:YD repeat-containing protein
VIIGTLSGFFVPAVGLNKNVLARRHESLAKPSSSFERFVSEFVAAVEPRPFTISCVYLIPALCRRSGRAITRYIFQKGLRRALAYIAGTGILFGTVGNALAQVPVTPAVGGGGGGNPPYSTLYYEQGNLIRSGEVIEALGPNLMGDRVNEYSGGLEFTQNDFVLPGNNALSVAISRHLAVGTRQAALAGGLFGDWDLEIPHLHTLSAATISGGVLGDWNGENTSSAPYVATESRCAQFFPPQQANGNVGTQFAIVSPNAWWDGYHLYVPGSGDQTLLARSTGNDLNQPTDGGIYPIITKANWQLSCLTALANGAGDAFAARASDGTRYQFDHLVKRPYVAYSPTGDNPRLILARNEVWILPSQITDRFGNWVRYSYDTTDGWKVLSISSSDGRTVTFTYVTGTHRIQTVSDGTRTWHYAYSGTGTLQSVTQPDSSTWQFSLQALEIDNFYVQDPSCDGSNFTGGDTTTHVGTITHPSGATGSFSILATWHGHSNVPGSAANCGLPGLNLVSTYFQNYSLTSKTLSGPGMPSMTWTYSYSTPSGSWTPCSGCVSTKTVTVTDPQNNVLVDTYGTLFGVNEGLLLTSAAGPNGSSALKTTSYGYAPSNAGPYPSLIGSSGAAVGDSMSRINTPQNLRTISQQGATFTQSISAFDAYARPTSVTRSSSLGFSRTESTNYYDQTSLWVMGQVASLTVVSPVNIVASSTTFYPGNALPNITYAFGKKMHTYAFNTDGTLFTDSDGVGQTTTYSNYMRGLAQHIAYADSTTQSAVVNNIGTIASVTNEAGTTWSFGYDAIGRIASATPPAGDPVAYNAKTFSFVQVGSSEYGIPANHWRQTITQGNGVTINYFDARWRKLLATTYDITNPSATQRSQIFTYDPYNRPTFSSYAQRSVTSVTSPGPGVATTYDALGRVNGTVSDSELGSLTTGIQYLNGFQTQTTDARGYSTTSSYQVFDDPDDAALATIVARRSNHHNYSRCIWETPDHRSRRNLWRLQRLGDTLVCVRRQPTIVQNDRTRNRGDYSSARCGQQYFMACDGPITDRGHHV